MGTLRTQSETTATKLGTDIGEIGCKGLHEVTFPPRMPLHGQPITFPAAAGGAALCGQALASLTCVTAISQCQKEGLGLPGCSAGPRWVLLAVSCPGADSQLRASSAVLYALIPCLRKSTSHQPCVLLQHQTDPPPLGCSISCLTAQT